MEKKHPKRTKRRLSELKRIAIKKMIIKPLLNNDTKFPTYPEITLCGVEETSPPNEAGPANLYFKASNIMERIDASSNTTFLEFFPKLSTASLFRFT